VNGVDSLTNTTTEPVAKCNAHTRPTQTLLKHLKNKSFLTHSLVSTWVMDGNKPVTSTRVVNGNEPVTSTTFTAKDNGCEWERTCDHYYIYC
jgi:hypothetical protein